MFSEHRRRRTGRVAAAAVVLAAALAVAPGLAEAAFVATATTNVSGQRTSATTTTIASPTNNVVTPVCLPVGSSGKYSLTLTVVSHGTVQGATGYTLSVYNSTGKVATVDLSQSVVYTSPNGGGNGWKYSVDAIQKFSATNTWSSNSPQVAVC
ncbi:hypothetical protein [Arthrobacter sp. M4]|uniref:hypothetical protein n=1 Tax=Arthrobacter sp. M4 TaxID=218160 RepID=UPI001CDB4BE9|nr:hypothetical protein [Arthrobacter sp. M4]MCA4134725.1 hypothetical protein [Arthrobacter sp. M4]